MDLNHSRSEADRHPFQSALQALGIGLIGGGIWLAYFVLREAYRLYRDVDGNVFVGALLARLPDKALFVFDGRPIELSHEGTLVVAILLFTVLASLGIRIAIALIRAGVEVLAPQFPRRLARLQAQVEQLREPDAGTRR